MSKKTTKDEVNNSENNSEINELDFEQAKEKFDALYEKLKNEKLPLEEAIKTFEDACAYHQRCMDILDQSKQKIEKAYEKIKR